MRSARLLLAFTCALLAACTSANDPPVTNWSAPQLIAPALQWNAPAIAVNRGQTAFVWTGFDNANVHQDARLSDETALQAPLILPLPPTHPLDQRLIPGADGTFHLFWLDVAADGGEGNRLFSALLSPELRVERGPVELSTAPTYSFDITTTDAGGALAIWTQDNPAEPDLWTAELDAAGLPRQPMQISTNSPAAALAHREDGGVQVFRKSEGQLWAARWQDDGALNWRALTATVGRRSGDRLDALWAASCGNQLCVGWNVTRRDGSVESWLASGPADGAGWNAPRRLDGLHWLTPATGTLPADGVLHAAAQADEGLALVRIVDGAITGQETAVEGVQLSGAPALAQTDAGWTLAWAETGADYAISGR